MYTSESSEISAQRKYRCKLSIGQRIVQVLAIRIHAPSLYLSVLFDSMKTLMYTLFIKISERLSLSNSSLLKNPL